jgi:cyclopropane-fatty-acyl-phospholipid synthase
MDIPNQERVNPVAPLTAFPPSGIYDVNQLVTLVCATPGAEIHFTTDGTQPTLSSPVFDPYRLIPTENVVIGGQSGKTVLALRAIAASGKHISAEAKFLYQTERRKQEEYVSREMAPGIRMIRDYDNDKMYLITGSRRALLVDTGMGSGDLRGYVESFTGGLPLDVVITHGHPDHIARMGQFQNDTAVYMNLDDLPIVQSFIERFRYDIDLTKIKDLREGSVFNLGGRRLQVYEVPGHSKGCVVLLDEDNGDLFSGDALGSNRPTIVDALWMQMPGNALIDEYLSSLQVFRSKVTGRVKVIYTGHNDLPLIGETYLDQLQNAAQSLVDQGVQVLVPSLRPTGVWQVLRGDRFTDPNWVAINVDRERFLTAPPEKLCSLSNLQLRGAVLQEKFHPSTYKYPVQAAAGVSQIVIIPTATSSRCKVLKVNGMETASGVPIAITLTGDKNTVPIVVHSADGNAICSYTLEVETSEAQTVRQHKHSQLTLDILNQLFDRTALQTVGFRLWDGTSWPDEAPRPTTIVLNHPGALRRIFRETGSDLSIGEAYIYEDFNIEGDIYAVFPLAEALLLKKLGLGERLSLGLKLLRLPSERKIAAGARQAADVRGRRHSLERDRQAITYHYNVSNDFYALFLDKNLVYSCAYFEHGNENLDVAQERKLDYLCRKLRLQPGERLLDIGCGWGGLVIYAAQRYGVKSLGVTLSQPQADLANERIRQAGLSELCRVEVRDYRELDERQPFDKLVSVGMFEHVGAALLPVYFEKAWNLLKSGGIFLNHGIAQNIDVPYQDSNFNDRYVFPDGELVPINLTLREAEKIGFEVRDVESLREHYARTLRHWVRRLEDNHATALRYVDEATYRVWRLFMSGSAHGFETGRLNLYQTLLVKAPGQPSGLPWSRADWYSG